MLQPGDAVAPPQPLALPGRAGPWGFRPPPPASGCSGTASGMGQDPLTLPPHPPRDPLLPPAGAAHTTPVLPVPGSSCGTGADPSASPASQEAPWPSCPMEPQQSETESGVSSLFGEKEGTSACSGSGPVSPLGFPAAPTQSSNRGPVPELAGAAMGATGAAFLEDDGLHTRRRWGEAQQECAPLLRAVWSRASSACLE